VRLGGERSTTDESNSRITKFVAAGFRRAARGRSAKRQYQETITASRDSNEENNQTNNSWFAVIADRDSCHRNFKGTASDTVSNADASCVSGAGNLSESYSDDSGKPSQSHGD